MLAMRDTIEGFPGFCAVDEEQKCDARMLAIAIKLQKIGLSEPKRAGLLAQQGQEVAKKADCHAVVARLLLGEVPDEEVDEADSDMWQAPVRATQPRRTRVAPPALPAIPDIAPGTPDALLAAALAEADGGVTNEAGDPDDEECPGDVDVDPEELRRIEAQAAAILKTAEADEAKRARGPTLRTQTDDSGLLEAERSQCAATIATLLGKILTKEWWASLKWVRDLLGVARRSLKRLDSDKPDKAGYALELQKNMYALLKRLENTGDDGGCAQACAKAGLAKWHYIRRERADQQFAIIAGNIFAIAGWEPKQPAQDVEAWPSDNDFTKVHLLLRDELERISANMQDAAPQTRVVPAGDDGDEEAREIAGRYKAQKTRRTLLMEYDQFLSLKARVNADADVDTAKFVWRPLDWWIEHMAEFPLLTPYVFDILLHLVTLPVRLSD
jgi:hypothetical protein